MKVTLLLACVFAAFLVAACSKHDAAKPPDTTAAPTSQKQEAHEISVVAPAADVHESPPATPATNAPTPSIVGVWELTRARESGHHIERIRAMLRVTDKITE